MKTDTEKLTELHEWIREWETYLQRPDDLQMVSVPKYIMDGLMLDYKRHLTMCAHE